MSHPIRIAVVGLGKIARDQHLPTIAELSSFKLVATINNDSESEVDEYHFNCIEALVNSGLKLDAVALCTPPQVRRRIATIAIEQGWHVFLEKPPGVTVAEIIALRNAAINREESLVAGWHLRFADAVEPARNWLGRRKYYKSRALL